jgi:hypothetical protein
MAMHAQYQADQQLAHGLEEARSIINGVRGIVQPAEGVSSKQRVQRGRPISGLDTFM